MSKKTGNTPEAISAVTKFADAIARYEDDVLPPVGWWRSRWSSVTWLLGAWPVLVAVAGTGVAGSLSIPHNDDWSYVKTARILAETGNLDMQGWARMSLVGQIYLAYPVLRVFGSNVAVLNTAMALVSLIGLSAAYMVFRRFGTTRAALLGTLVTSLFPGYLLLSTSFMSDVPAFTAMTTCVAVGLRALERRSRVWLWTALTIGAVGVTIRYQAAAAPLAVLLVWALLPQQEDSLHRRRRTALAGGAGFAAFVVAFMWWRLALPQADNPSVSTLQPGYLARSMVAAFPVLGLALLPFTALCLDRLLFLSRHTGAWLLAIGSAAGLVLVHYMSLPIFSGNYLDRFGPYQAAGYGSSPPIVPLRTWQALETLGWVAVTAALLLLLWAMRPSAVTRLRVAWRGNRLDRAPALLLGIFAVLYAGTLIAPTLIGLPIFDRYLVPLLVPTGAGLLVLAGSASRRAAFCSAASVVLLAVMAIVLTTVSARDDTIRWQTSAHLVQQGASPTDVSSGLEWQGTYATHPARSARMLEPMPAGQYADWTRMFDGDRDCWFITRTATPSPHLRLTQTIHYTRFPGLPRGELYVYRTDLCS
jgi:4-amino-4-deoxy-L-arabinose transferase-like glycosyltransferase